MLLRSCTTAIRKVIVCMPYAIYKCTVLLCCMLYVVCRSPCWLPEHQIMKTRKYDTFDWRLLGKCRSWVQMRLLITPSRLSIKSTRTSHSMQSLIRLEVCCKEAIARFVLLPAISMTSLDNGLTQSHCSACLAEESCHDVLPDRLPGSAGPTTSQSLAVLKKNGHISFVLNENIDYFKLTAG